MNKRLTILTAAMLLVAATWPQPPAHADVTGCTATVAEHQVQANSDTNFHFQLTNDGSTSPINWFQVPQLPGYFDVVSANASGWVVDINANQVIFSGGTLNSGDTMNFTIEAAANYGPTGQVYWNVQASDDNGATGPYCDGDTSTEVVQPQAPQITNLALSDLSSTSVTVSWDTDQPSDSAVQYGLDQSYGSTTNSSAQVLSHSVILSGLQANTGYHYEVSSTNANGTSTSGDNTFLTAIQESGGSSSSPAPSSTVPGVAIQAVPTEHVPPTISMSTSFAKPFKTAPAIAGTAADNVAVARVEYSTDGGRDWLPADHLATKNGGANVSFSFTPILTDDGNYQIVARATDSSGNTATTPPATLVIDRLPPQLGPLVVAYGPESLEPDSSGVVHLVAGSDYRLSASTVGGPTAVNLVAAPPGQAPPPNRAPSFALTPDAASGLWNGLLSFKAGGNYRLIATAVDGAGNRTSRTILAASVAPPGRVASATTARPVTGATLSLYYLEPVSGTWQLWQGEPYGQNNPQTTTAGGSYSLMVTRGKYYLRVSAPHYRSFTSDIFTVAHPQAITAMVALSPLPHLGPLYLPDISWSSHPLLLAGTSASAPVTNLAGSLLPDFNLPSTAGGTQHSIDLTGKPTVITVLTSWAPAGQQQLSALASAQANHDINVVPVFEQQSLPLVSTYLATGGFNLTALADPDDTLVPALGVGLMPEHIFVDRTGHIKTVMVGVLSNNELLSELGGL